MTSVAVLIACHNRRASTLAALGALLDTPTSADLEVFMVDDGSTDGTAEAVESRGWPVHVQTGDGSLYWAAAMAMAERAAVQTEPDFLLWLNDDTIADPGALDCLLTTSSQFDDSAIVVGATRDPDTGTVTYGGRRRTSSWHPQRFTGLSGSPTAQSADTFNGNLVLVPMAVRRLVGPIDGLFPHAYADDDYGLRASELGVEIIQAPGTLATCARQETARTVAGWRHRQQPKGLPLRSQIRFFRRHGGKAWMAVLVSQQMKWAIKK